MAISNCRTGNRNTNRTNNLGFSVALAQIGGGCCPRNGNAFTVFGIEQKDAGQKNGDDRIPLPALFLVFILLSDILLFHASHEPESNNLPIWAS